MSGDLSAARARCSARTVYQRFEHIQALPHRGHRVTDSIVQVRTVVLLAMLAIVRKLIILDLEGTQAAELFGLAAAMLALGG